MTRGRAGHRSGRLAGVATLALLVSSCGESPLEPVGPTRLEPGESTVVRGSAVRGVRLEGGDAARGYLVVVQNVARSPGSLAMTIALTAEDGVVASAARGARGSVASATRPVVPTDARLELESRMREALRRAGAQPGRQPRPASDRDAPARAAVAPARGTAVGDTLRLNAAVRPDLSVECADTTRSIRAVVRTVGERFVLAEDLEIERGFLPSEWAGLASTLEQVIFPVGSAYFGSPADLDDNGRILLLFTPAVNRLTPPGSDTFIGGFFWPGDLADRTSCPVSNRGEILYLLAPDVLGRFGNVRTSTWTRRNALEVAAHELAHLLVAQQRLTLGSGGFDDLEEVWLSEGMAHLAEEVTGLRAAGRPTRAGLVWDRTSDAFDIWILGNFARLARHLQAPDRTPGLAAEDPSSLASLAMRGNAWIFLRWLADRHGPDGDGGPLSGSDEARLFRELAGGGPAHATGIANLERALSELGTPVAWEELLASFGPALAPFGPEAGAPAPVETWDLDEVFGTLFEFSTGEPFVSVHPLRPTRVDLGDVTRSSFELDVAAFGARYFQLESRGPTPDVLLELTTRGGKPLRSSTAVQVTIVRTR